MIDIHCHLLPALDDGSQSEEQSLAQLRSMVSGGITHAFLTTHYLSRVYNYDRSEYDEKLQQLKRLALSHGLDISLEQGFEIFLHPRTGEDIASHNLTLGKSRYVLIESDLNGLPPDFYTDVYPLLRKGYKPILAHAERYVSIMHKP
ncbi:MAG TPA: capsular biosynthesis protein, partial [Candidatus Syntrophosphaera sp.]|nr:capsular biosynthesis protein [Candidatus Syntrophosphaera sp.]